MLFDDYVPPSPESSSKQYPPSETSSERAREDEWMESFQSATFQEIPPPPSNPEALCLDTYPAVLPVVYPQPQSAPSLALSQCLTESYCLQSMPSGLDCGGALTPFQVCHLLDPDFQIKNGQTRQSVIASQQPTKKWRGKQKLALLHAFKQRAGTGFCLKDMWGHMIHLSKDQLGSRFLQRELRMASPLDQERYFQEISHQALSIASDVFGNFILQVLLETGNPVIATKLVLIIKPHMVELSTRPYGCRVVQKAIEALPYEAKRQLAASLEGNVESCAHNEHGNHVLQRCLQNLLPHDVAFVYRTVAEKTRTMSKDRYGCRVVQRAIEHRHANSSYSEPIRQRIAGLAVEFAFDEFANFVVQKLLRTASRPLVERIAESFLPHLIRLSCQKFPSNVVETTLSVCSPQMAQRIKTRLLGLDLSTNAAHLSAVVRDRFGHYVLQKLIHFCTEDEKSMLRDAAEAILLASKDDPALRSLTKRMHRLLHAL